MITTFLDCNMDFHDIPADEVTATRSETIYVFKIGKMHMVWIIEPNDTDNVYDFMIFNKCKGVDNLYSADPKRVGNSNKLSRLTNKEVIDRLNTIIKFGDKVYESNRGEIL
jgi:hypothetical protein